MADGKLSTSLQESVLTLICMNEDQGAIATSLIDTELFEPPYDEVAAKAISYRQKFKKAPGAAHLDDLFDHILSDPKNKRKRIFEQVLSGIIDQAEGLNAEYVLSRVSEFLRRQELKAAVLDAAECYQRPGEDLAERVEVILNKALKSRPTLLSPGVFLGDRKQVLSIINAPKAVAYQLGIPDLDRRGIGPTAGEALLFMAPAGRGKTWFAVDAGVKTFLQRGRVVHISLEMSEERILSRYMMRLFAIAKRDEPFNICQFDRDELDKIIGFSQKRQQPRLAFNDPNLPAKLGKRLDQFGARLNRIVVKQFPTSQLTMGGLIAYLDHLELVHNFIPTALILDYPKLMKLDGKEERRIALGHRVEELRGLCVERKLAGIFPIQSNREGESASLLTGQHVGEDYSQLQTADTLLSYNQTKLEKELGLARLHVNKGRSDDDKFSVLITQSYNTGRFCVDSSFMPNKYIQMVKASTDSDDADDSTE